MTVFLKYTLGIIFFNVSSYAAVINLNFYNTVALLDEVSNPLLGNGSSGDFVELLTLGPNNVVDTPNQYTGVPGDDVLFGLSNIPTHVGAGTFGPGNDSGLLVQPNITFDDSLVGTAVYVRFWNGGTLGSSSYYGTIESLSIPAPVFGESYLDFAPSGGPFLADTPFSISPGAVPEPGTTALIVLACVGIRRWSQFKRWAVRPEQLQKVRQGVA